MKGFVTYLHHQTKNHHHHHHHRHHHHHHQTKKRGSIYSYRNHQRDSEVAKPKKKKKLPMVNESMTSGSDSEVDKEKENLLEDDHYDKFTIELFILFFSP